MRLLTRTEILNCIQQTKSMNEEQGLNFINRFCQQQPAMQEMIFVGFPMAIQQQNEIMANIFMDICFEIAYTYENVLGKLRANIVSPEWLQQKVKEIDDEVKAQSRTNEQGQIEFTGESQTELLAYVVLALEEAAGHKRSLQEAAGMTYNLLFLVTRVFDKIYAEMTPEVFH
ncbi:hypothetical protein DOJK_01764 [Patescibacteria group bacterium]|nr:hypothetical protein DOJK_01764 [Patescibacteria group bacterium]